MNIKDIHKKVINGTMTIDELKDIQPFIAQEYKRAMKGEFAESELESLIRVLIDYYIYSSDGDVLITDTEYDKLMRVWTEKGNTPITTADDLKITESIWPMISHRMTSMVGSVVKIYSDDELFAWMDKILFERYQNKSENLPPVTFVVAPKFDGISCYFEVRNGQISFAATRGTGVEGQDMLQLVKRVSNADVLASGKDGFYKCELVMDWDHFYELQKIKEYKNRRSACSGICNGPSNLDLARFITAIPLAYYDPSEDNVSYLPVGAQIVKSDNVTALRKQLLKTIEYVRDTCMDPSFPYRTDGVVIYPVEISDYYGPGNDIMEYSVAYKFNGAEAVTYIEDVYISIGRLGGATPMAKVRACDVNETTVTDVSLSTFDKFEKMDLHYGEKVIVFSAGDVIPQLRMPKSREYGTGKKIKLDMKCPICGHSLEKVARNSKENKTVKEEGKLWRCSNERCPRITCGRIANFIAKVGGESISDKTVEMLYDAKRIRDVVDLLNIKYSDVIDLDGFSTVSSTLLEEEIKRIRTKETQASDLLGALGIPDIGSKTCKLILSRVSLDKLLRMKKSQIMDECLELDGIGMTTAEKFAGYIKENRDEIIDIVDMMNIVQDKTFEFGNIVFTGFRSSEYEEKFKDLGVDIGDSVNKKTIAVFADSLNSGSGKVKKARKLMIPLYERKDLAPAYEFLKDYIKNLRGEFVNPFYD